MGEKVRVSGRELVSRGWPEGKVVGLAIAAGNAYADAADVDAGAALEVLDRVLEEPDQWTELTSFSDVAKELIRALEEGEKAIGVRDNHVPFPVWGAEHIELAWRDESRRVRISYLDSSYEPVRYPEDASYVLSTVFFPSPPGTEEDRRFFFTKLFARLPEGYWPDSADYWIRLYLLPDLRSSRVIWTLTSEGIYEFSYTSYDDAVAGHLLALDELREGGAGGDTNLAKRGG